MIFLQRYINFLDKSQIALYITDMLMTHNHKSNLCKRYIDYIPTQWSESEMKIIADSERPHQPINMIRKSLYPGLIRKKDPYKVLEEVMPEIIKQRINRIKSQNAYWLKYGAVNGKA